MSEEGTEQITKVPTELQGQPPKKEKDPKVAAGKKLAAYNKEAKEALERERKRELENKSEKKNEAVEPSSKKNDEWITIASGLTPIKVRDLINISLFGATARRSKQLSNMADNQIQVQTPSSNPQAVLAAQSVTVSVSQPASVSQLVSSCVNTSSTSTTATYVSATTSGSAFNNQNLQV